MSFRFTADDISKLPQETIDKLIKADPSLLQELKPYKWTGVMVTSEYRAIVIVVRDRNELFYTINDFIEIEIKNGVDKRLFLKEWKQFLMLARSAGGDFTDEAIYPPHELQKKIFSILELEEIFIEERETGKYSYLLEN